MKRFLKSLAIGFILALPWVGDVSAQQVNLYCQVSAGPPQIWGPCNGGNPLSVNASVSASITGFPTTQTTGTPISVTTGGVTGTLPTGTVVVASNVGATNGAYCKLGASATTSDQLIPPNSWFAFTVGAATQLTCITSTSTTTVNMVGGSGLPTGSGGGGGGSGGGAVTIASGAVASGAYSSGSIASGAVSSGAFASGSIGSGAVASGAVSSGAYASGALAAGAFAAGAGVDGWDLTQGAKGDAACAGGGSACSIEARLAHIENLQAAAIPAGSAIIGKVGIDQTTPGTTNGVQVNAALPAGTNRIGYISDDPCNNATAKIYTPISQTANARLITGTSAKKTYICSLMIIASDAENVSLIEGTGSTCGTNPVAVIGGATAANGMNMAANGGFTFGNGTGSIAATSVNADDTCLFQSGSGRVSGAMVTATQ